MAEEHDIPENTTAHAIAMQRNMVGLHSNLRWRFVLHNALVKEWFFATAIFDNIDFSSQDRSTQVA
jgi:hypothetical protein